MYASGCTGSDARASGDPVLPEVVCEMGERAWVVAWREGVFLVE